MRVAVTGGSGVVGRAVVRHLIDRGDEVWALARSEESARNLDQMGCRVVTGDLLDFDAVSRLVKGSNTVYHVAGVNEMCPLDPVRMWRVNVEGTTAILDASSRMGVTRIVYTSSAVTMGEAKGQIGTETSPHRGYFLSEYERSKTVAERLILHTDRDIEVVSVNPSSVQGPGRATGTGALLLAAARGRLPFLVDATFSIVDIDDCARGHLAAADRGEPGQRYVLSGHVTTVRDAVAHLTRSKAGISRPWFIRPEVLSGVAPVAAAVSKAFGRQPLLCPESARVLLSGHRYDGSRAHRELGITYTALSETLDRTLGWFEGEGLL